LLYITDEGGVKRELVAQEQAHLPYF